ncbi:MAG: ABC transporter permease, partial [Limisphaerales bacterium]
MQPFGKNFGRSRGKSALFNFVNFFGPFIGLLLVIGLFSLNAEVRPFFLSGGNFKIILTQTVIVAIGALGMTMIIVSGGIDLSVGSVVALASVVGATLLVKNFPPLAAASLTILVGGLIGLTNGVLISNLRMMPFIVTLGMMGVARGTAKWLSNSQTVNPPENSLNNLMALSDPTNLLPVPTGVWLAIGLAIFLAIIMRKTVFGRYIFAMGGNEIAARYSG